MKNFNTVINLNLIMLVSAVIFFLTGLVGFRELNIGRDTVVYAEFFESQSSHGYVGHYEPLFEYLMLLVASLVQDVSYFFAAQFLLLNAFFIYLIYLVKRYFFLPFSHFSLLILLLFGFLFYSSWYQVASTNGLRQGLALVVMYCAMLLLLSKKYLKSIFFYLLSIGFHYSSILLLPFIYTLKLKLSLHYSIFLLLLLGYVAGLNEFLVGLFSGLFNIGVYELIRSYDEGAPWVGFQLNFVFYSVFWSSFFLFCGRYVKSMHKEKYYLFLKAYNVMLMPFFVFGFGGFPNRLAIIAWLFIPVLQSLFVLLGNIDFKVKGGFALLVFLSGLMNYIMIFL